MNKNEILSGAVINNELNVLKTLLLDGESEIPCFYKMCFPGLCCFLSVICFPWVAYTLLNDDIYSRASILQFTLLLGLALFVSITGVASLILSLPSNFMKQSDLFKTLKLRCKTYALTMCLYYFSFSFFAAYLHFTLLSFAAYSLVSLAVLLVVSMLDFSRYQLSAVMFVISHLKR
ncbi:hypothetical protein [Enterobacter hormaechei]|uniref:hypothetical protein n=1 Tax=Enterobacter hormaechei TaxID=158836 RepID=UPI0032DB0FAA